PVVGETWSIQLTFDGGTRSISHTIAVGQAVGDIAKAIASGISTSLGTDFTAVADGSRLVIIRRTEGGFSVSFQTAAAAVGQTTVPSAIVTLTGTPATGEIWTVVLGGVAFNVTVGGAVVTLSDIAAALAVQIN